MKDNIRKALIAIRKLIPKEDRIDASGVIAGKVIDMPQWQKAKTVCLYISRWGEVDTKELVGDAIQRKKKILFTANGIDRRSLRKADLFIVPGVAFDKKGYRIGWGKGYYDKLLSGVTAPKIGLAYAIQMVAKVPRASYDIPMDIVVTEQEIINSRCE